MYHVSFYLMEMFTITGKLALVQKNEVIPDDVS